MDASNLPLLANISAELSDMKIATSDMKVALTSQTAQMPPVDIFASMIGSLSEINKSLHTLNEVQTSSTSSNIEALVILRDIQSSLAAKDANLPPPPVSDEITQLLNDVRSALDRGQARNSSVPSGATVPWGTGVSPQIRSGKRRIEKPFEPIAFDSPKRQKQIRASQTVCTGPVNTELVTVTVAQQKPDDEDGKSMVASRFAPSTEASKVLAYVKTKLELPDDSNVVTVRSLAPRNRPLSDLTFVSFKVTVPEDSLAKLMDPSFWPANTTIREFEQRESRTATFFWNHHSLSSTNHALFPHTTAQQIWA